MKSPLQRSMEMLRAEGFTVAKTEHWNPFSKTREDLLGCMDLIAIHPNVIGVTGVNSCAASGVSSHKKKYEENERLKMWLKAGNGFEIHGWYPWKEEEKRDEVREVEAYADQDGKIGWREHGHGPSQEDHVGGDGSSEDAAEG